MIFYHRSPFTASPGDPDILIAPAKGHGKLLLMHAAGKIDTDRSGLKASENGVPNQRLDRVWRDGAARRRFQSLRQLWAVVRQRL